MGHPMRLCPESQTRQKGKKDILLKRFYGKQFNSSFRVRHKFIEFKRTEHPLSGDRDPEQL